MAIKRDKNKLFWFTKGRIAYSLGAFGNDVFYFALSTYLINFITSTLISPDNPNKDALVSAITIIIMVLRIVELLIDPFIGNAIDRTKTKWGHFRPWIVVGGAISSVVLLVLFTDMGGLVNTNPWLYLVIFAVLYITMDIFYSFKDVGFWSMLPALSFDTREREKTATFARVGSAIGASLVGVVVMPVVLFFSLDKSSSSGDLNGWFWFGFIVAAVAFITAVIVGLGTKEKENALRKNKKETKGIKAVFSMLIKNDQLLWTAIGYMLYCTAICMVNSLELYYFQFIMDYPKGFSILQGINMVVGILSVGVFPVLTRRFQRKRVLYVSFASMLLGLILFYFADKNLILVLIAAELFYIPQPIVFLVVLMTITDSVEYGQLLLGHRDESLALSVRPLCDKFGSAVSNGVVGQTAIIAGMTTGATAASLTASGIFAFKIIMLVIPAILIVISLFVFWHKVTLDEKAHDNVMKMLKIIWVDAESKK